MDDASVNVKAGDAEAMIEAAGGGRIELKLGDASLTLTGRGDIVVKTNGKLSLQGGDVEIVGQSSVTMSGPQVSVN